MALDLSHVAAALISLSYFLFLPFGVDASRSFQPDPGMVMWTILTIYALYRWGEKQTEPGHPKGAWGWAILAGICGGIAIITKVVAIYLVAPVALAVVFMVINKGGRQGWLRAWRNGQVWVIALLMILPFFTYYFFGRQDRATEYVESWTIALSKLLITPGLYIRWFNLLVDLMGLGALILAVIGKQHQDPAARQNDW